MATVTQEQINDLTALYVGYFDRAPDPVGLQFWIDQIDGGREFNTIAADFAASPEALDLYPYLSTPGVSTPAAFITSIYMNLFNRTPDDDGLAFWEDALADGSVSAADMIEAIINGARDDADATPPSFDASVLDNKVEVGLDFAEKTANEPGFEFDAAAMASAKAVLDGVDETDASVDAGMAQTDAFIAGDSITSNPGDTILLTPQIDNLVGTDGDDTFIANDYDGIPPHNAGDNQPSLQSQDIFDGAGGNNVLNIASGAIGNGGVAAPTISNIQTINNADIGTFGADGKTGLDLSNATGVKEVWTDLTGVVDTSTNINNDTPYVVYENVSLDTTFGIRGFNDNGTGSIRDSSDISIFATAAAVAGDDSTLKLAMEGSKLQNSTSDQVINVVARTPGIEHVEIDVAAGNEAVTLNLGTDALDLETITITGDGDLKIDPNTGSKVNTDNSIELFDASAAGGDITWNPSADTASNSTVDLVTVLGGSGNDTFDLSKYMENDIEVTVDAGAGNDTVTLSGLGNTKNVLNTVTLGAGKDTFKLDGALSNIFDASEDEFESGMIVITDFNASDDVLELGATFGDLVTFTNTQSGNIADADSLFDALGVAAGVLGDDEAGIFDYNGDAYLFSNGGANDAEFDSGDGLVQLVGMSAGDFEAGVSLVA